MKKIVKLCKGIFDALLVLVIVCALTLLLAPRLLGAKVLVVLSQSMEPTIPMGAIVVSRPVSASEVKVGDAITFSSPGGGSDLITHRVVEIVGSGIAVSFRTQGDATEEPDLELVQPFQLVGRVLFSVPYLGYGAHFTRTPLGFILLLGLPAALLVGGEVWSMIRAARKKTASAPQRVPQKTPSPKSPRPRTSSSLGLAGRLRGTVKAVAKMATRAAERIPPNLPARNQARQRARDVPLWQQVRALQAQVEALQAEVTLLRQQLAHLLPDPSELQAVEPLQAPAGSAVYAELEQEPGLELAVAVELADRSQEGRLPLEEALPPAIEEGAASEQVPGDLIERLAAALPRWAWLGLIANLVAVFLLVNSGLPRILPASLTRNVAQPLLWSCLAVQAFLCWRFDLDPEARPPLSIPLAIGAGLIGAVQIGILYGTGLLLGFERSPDGFQFLTLLGNLVCMGTMLVGMEISRAYLLAVSTRRYPWLALILLSLLFSLVGFPLGSFEGVDSVATFFQAAREIFLPAFCQNLLASLLALIGGPVASLAYRSPILAFEWLSPVRPDLVWGVTALLGSAVPTLGYFVIRWQFLRQLAEENNTQTDRARSPAVWARVWMRITPLVTGGARGIARTLRGHKPERVAEVPLNPQGR